MKQLAIAGICLFAAPAWAVDGKETDEVVDMVQVRLSEMETINVTAEKTAIESTDDLDVTIESILEEADALEAEQSEE